MESTPDCPATHNVLLFVLTFAHLACTIAIFLLSITLTYLLKAAQVDIEKIKFRVFKKAELPSRVTIHTNPLYDEPTNVSICSSHDYDSINYSVLTSDYLTPRSLRFTPKYVNLEVIST